TEDPAEERRLVSKREGRQSADDEARDEEEQENADPPPQDAGARRVEPLFLLSHRPLPLPGMPVPGVCTAAPAQARRARRTAPGDERGNGGGDEKDTACTHPCG